MRGVRHGGAWHGLLFLGARGKVKVKVGFGVYIDVVAILIHLEFVGAKVDHQCTVREGVAHEGME